MPIDAELTANIETIKRGFDAKVADKRAALSEWIDERNTPGNGGIITVALLELAIERQLGLSDENGARDLFEGSATPPARPGAAIFGGTP